MNFTSIGLHYLNDNENLTTSRTEAVQNNTQIPILPDIYPCKWILYEEIRSSRVRIWDVAIFVPNVFFLLFLLLKVRKARQRLQQSNSPIFSAFLILVFFNSLIGVIRCIVSMSVNASVHAADIADKVLWLLLRFFMLFTEMSVIVFGLAFGHLDSRSSIKRVIIVTSAIALIYSGTQGVLEIAIPDSSFHIETKGFDVFAHGGMLFWFISSALFTLVYATVFILPWTPINNRVALPVKKSFYIYCMFLALLNLIQCIGSALLYFSVREGMCMVDLTTYIYFTCFTPLVYQAFLSEFFGSVNLSILFSYKSHHDETDDINSAGGGGVVGGLTADEVSLPSTTLGGGGGSAAILDASGNTLAVDVLYNNTDLYDSTHFMPSPPADTAPQGGLDRGRLALHFTADELPAATPDGNHSANSHPVA